MQFKILEINGYSGYYIDKGDGLMSYKGQNKGTYNAEHYLNSDFPHYIQSIKRISDNKIFRIGDVINKYGTIKRLRVVPGGSFGKLYQFSCEENNGWIDLYTIPKKDHFKHQKNPIESYKIVFFDFSDEQLLLLL